MKILRNAPPGDLLQSIEPATFELSLHRHILFKFYIDKTENDSTEVFYLSEASLDSFVTNGIKNLSKTASHFKLIGPRDLIAKVSKPLVTAGFENGGDIVRNSGFEVIYELPSRRLRVSLVQASPKAVEPEVKKKIRVMVVDDSRTIQSVLREIFSKDPDIELVAGITEPKEVISKIAELKPDVITMDIHMPEMDGLTLLQKYIKTHPIPTVMISALTPEDGPYVLKALEYGAVDYVRKPEFHQIGEIGPLIVEKVKSASRANLKQLRLNVGAITRTGSFDMQKPIVIGSSTGGTEALTALFKTFPDQVPPILVTQHIPPVFSKAFAERLNGEYSFSVKEAEDGDKLLPNRVLIAPGGKQMRVKSFGGQVTVEITDDGPVNRHKPSVDYLFDSVAEHLGGKVIAMILTGMGADGARGLKKLRDLGALTIAQDKDSCVVFGMPRVAIEMGAAELILPLNEIANGISKRQKKAA